MIRGVPIETIYLYGLIICAAIAFLLVIFGDIVNVDGPLDPMLIVPWLAFTSLFGYLFERLSDWNHLLVVVLAALFSTLVVFILNFYVLMPIKQAEATISISEKELEGNTAVVTIPIPVNGLGEIQMKRVTGSINRPAAFYAPQEQSLVRGSQVLIIEIKDRVCYVVPYKGSLQL